MLDYVQNAGVESIEIGTGAYRGNAHCNVDELLVSDDKRKGYLDIVQSCELRISAFSCHSNPVSPDKQIAQQAHETFVKTVKLI